MRLRSLPFLCSVVSLTAQVPARLLANRTSGEAGIYFGLAFFEIHPRLQWPWCRPGFWPTEPVAPRPGFTHGSSARLLARPVSLQLCSADWVGL